MKRNGIVVELGELQRGNEVSGIYYGEYFTGTVIDNYKSGTVRYNVIIWLRDPITVNRIPRSLIVINAETDNLSV